MKKACTRMEAFLPRYWGLSVDLLYASLKDHITILEAWERGGEKSGRIPERPRIQFSSGMNLTIS